MKTNEFIVKVGTRTIDYMKWDGEVKITQVMAKSHYLAGTAPDGAINPRCLLGADQLTVSERAKLKMIPHGSN